MCRPAANWISCPAIWSANRTGRALPDAMAAQIDAAIFEIRTFNRPVQNECELSRNGQRTCLHLSINMLAGSDRAPTGYLIVAQDITAQKQAEEETAPWRSTTA